MFVYNVSLNKTNTVKFIFVVVAIALLVFLGISGYRIIMASMDRSITVQDNIPNDNVVILTTENYTNVLKTVHDNVDNYVGKTIELEGYIYKLPDFNEMQFVLARDMVINSSLQTLVVGFLCNYNKANEFSNNTWVELTGKIIKGKFYEEIPVIEITEIKQKDRPKEYMVYPPDEHFIPTINLF